jgi:hypothetical protein
MQAVLKRRQRADMQLGYTWLVCSTMPNRISNNGGNGFVRLQS